MYDLVTEELPPWWKLLVRNRDYLRHFKLPCTVYDLRHGRHTGGLDWPLRNRLVSRMKEDGYDSSHTVLDLATGPGHTSILAGKALKSRIIQCDRSKPMADLADENARRAGLDAVSTINGDITDLSLADNSVEGITWAFGPGCLDNDTREEALAECYRVLRPGGRIYTLDILPPCRDIIMPVSKWLNTMFWGAVWSWCGRRESFEMYSQQRGIRNSEYSRHSLDSDINRKWGDDDPREEFALTGEPHGDRLTQYVCRALMFLHNHVMERQVITDPSVGPFKGILDYWEWHSTEKLPTQILDAGFHDLDYDQWHGSANSKLPWRDWRARFFWAHGVYAGKPRNSSRGATL
ncbi:MAG: methyltransferase domain-containing protein [Candidatus Woesearchaeota archaeon]|nr:methyltransferase domain-containing protein [Candidatus Woesearchaeota archaeon]MDP7181429.1 methyltransferase domain-containing protein [Candidatus Woesearchaeota archaeon]MDP7198471.1 methyltransferase domain-containing protein [Candidatus Woesearchaeota archaeon]MDP7466787.1 methyltransferase domain-containing protein [Candidatus Woesearchaeota archaeon]MDP7648012.1 methyltransferase domain-containing protein [Candidatus Woesearchaeota archaeon]